MSNNEITSIVFLPVCKKCLNVIWQTVNCEERAGIIYGMPRMASAEYDIEPQKCPHCGRFIDNISIPTKLPFNSSKYLKGW